MVGSLHISLHHFGVFTQPVINFLAAYFINFSPHRYDFFYEFLLLSGIPLVFTCHLKLFQSPLDIITLFSM